MQICLTVLAVGLCVLTSSSAEAQYFGIKKDDRGHWWFVTPEGKPFFSRGVNVINPAGDYEPETKRFPYLENILSKYGSEVTWAEVTQKRLSSWGWNTVGAWSRADLFPNMPYTAMMECSKNFESGDLFSVEFRDYAEAKAEKVTHGRSQDPKLIGYFIDNELPWGRDHRNRRDLFDLYFSKSDSSEGKKALIQILETKYVSIEALNDAWKASYSSFLELGRAVTIPETALRSSALKKDRSLFLRAVALHYYETCSTALRKRDSHHLLLGSRLMSILTWPEVLEAIGKTQDVVSVNNYEFNLPALAFARIYSGKKPVAYGNWLREFHRLTGKPILISEFGFRAVRKDLHGTWPPVFSWKIGQHERARSYLKYANEAYSKPWIVGYHAFQWMDQPQSGRFDGENNNFGMVDIFDEPWKTVTNALQTEHLRQDEELRRVTIHD